MLLKYPHVQREAEQLQHSCNTAWRSPDLVPGLCRKAIFFLDVYLISQAACLLCLAVDWGNQPAWAQAVADHRFVLTVSEKWCSTNMLTSKTNRWAVKPEKSCWHLSLVVSGSTDSSQFFPLGLIETTFWKRWRSCLVWRIQTSSVCWECVWAAIPSAWSQSTWNVETWTSICPTECFLTSRYLQTMLQPSGKMETLFRSYRYNCSHSCRVYLFFPSSVAFPPQLPSPHFNGESDCLRNEVPVFPQLCAPGSGHT